jgi:hypothetical protein
MALHIFLDLIIILSIYNVCTGQTKNTRYGKSLKAVNVDKIKKSVVRFEFFLVFFVCFFGVFLRFFLIKFSILKILVVRLANDVMVMRAFVHVAR